MFLVGAFSFKGLPVSYSDLFSPDLTLIGPLFTEITKTTKAGQRKLVERVPAFNFLTFLMLPAKPDETEGSHLSIFFSAMRLSKILLLSPKGLPSILLKLPP